MSEDASVTTGPFQVFRYVGHGKETKAPKKLAHLCRTDVLRASVQLVQKGGENNLHSHSGEDGFWMVLKGRAVFYDEDDEIVADLGPLEGVLVPRNVPYWFESSDDDVPLELLHVSAIELGVDNDRVDHRPRNVRGRAPA